MSDYRLICGDAVQTMATLPDASVDCVITDPPYPEIDRAYGRMSEAEWWEMMMGVCAETRRLLKPAGSAVFILQPNSRKVGSMRGWLWEFMAWVCREWNMVQDAYWWNTTTMPQGSEARGLMRGSAKPCVWAGAADCYRAQNKVLWGESQRNVQRRVTARASNDTSLDYRPSGVHVRESRISEAAERRGGVTPFNVLPIPNGNSVNSAGAYGHGAGTPLELAKWWTRYICPPGGTVLDPFVGSGTMVLAAMHYGCKGIGIERDPGYYAIACERAEQAAMQPMLFNA